MSTKKMEEVIARDLGEQLQLLLSTLTDASYTEGTDSDGNPTIAFGTQTAGSQNAFIRIKGEAIGGVDSLGLTQRVYQPHVIQVALEEASASGATILSLANVSQLLQLCQKAGAKVEVYLSANASIPSVNSITAANLEKTLWPDIYNKMKASV